MSTYAYVCLCTGVSMYRCAYVQVAAAVEHHLHFDEGFVMHLGEAASDERVEEHDAMGGT